MANFYMHDLADVRVAQREMELVQLAEKLRREGISAPTIEAKSAAVLEAIDRVAKFKHSQGIV